MSLIRVCCASCGKGSLSLFLLCLLVALPISTNAQIQHAIGQNVAPIFEGWERLPDGSFDMVFGYLNRNYEEELNIPVGPNNSFEPGVDRGQPTHFYIRRQQFAFRVHVPKDWGNKELIWTLTAYGRTQQAFGTLDTMYELDQEVYRANRGGPPSEGANQPPSINVAGAARQTARISEPLTLTVNVTDDGNPPRRTPRRVSRDSSEPAPVRPENQSLNVRQTPIAQAVVRLDPGVRLGVTWVFYRGAPGTVSIEPMRTAVLDGKATTNVSFSEPGTYQVRAYADDGVLTTAADITVTVN